MIKASNVLGRDLTWGWKAFAFLNLKQDVTVGVLLTIIIYIIVYIHLSHVCLAQIVYMLVRGNRGITRKCRNPEAPRSTRKLLIPAQRHYWWDAYTKATHQQLLQLVTVIQELWIIEEKWRFVPSIRHLKRSDKKLDEDAQRCKKWYRLFLSMTSKVLTQWLTWRRGTLTFLTMCFIIRYNHCGMKRVRASYYSVCICSTIGKHTLAYSSHEIVFFTAGEH